MSEGSTPESALPPEVVVTSPTEASNRWVESQQVRLAPAAAMVLVGAAAVRSQFEPIGAAIAQGNYGEAALRGLLAGAAGAASLYAAARTIGIIGGTNEK